MEYSVEQVMEKAKLTENKAIDFMNEVRNNTIVNGGKCVRVIKGGKLDKVITGCVPKSKYRIRP